MHADPCIERVGFQTIGGDQQTPSNFQDCLYQILPMLNYDSTEAHQTLSRRASFSSSKDEKEMIELRIKQEYQQNLQAVKKYQTGKEKVRPRTSPPRLIGSCIN